MLQARHAGFLRYIRDIVTQAWPVMVSSWAHVAFGVMDTAMAGHSSAADLQAMALSVSIYITVFISLMGVIHALIPILAQHFGARRLEQVGQSWAQGVWLALALSAVGAITLALPDAWLTLSGDVSPEVRHSVTWYLRALIVALPAALIFRTIYCLGTAVSRPKVVMVINLGSVAFKLLFNWVFIFGHLGSPALGAVGAGVSTALTSWITVFAGLWFIKHDRWFAQFSLRLRRPRWKPQIELLRLGLPMGGSYLVEIATFTLMALLVAQEGMFVTGGHQIMSNLAALCYMMPMAVGVASASLTAQAIGAGKMTKARDMGRAGIAVVTAGALLTSTLLVVAREPILTLYTNDAQLAMVAATLLPLLPFFHIADALHCVGAYLLRAYKVAVVPLLLQIVALTGISLIGGWWLGFGPGAGTLAPIIARVLPDAPTGAASMWLMAFTGMTLSATLMFLWYGYVVRRTLRPQA